MIRIRIKIFRTSNQSYRRLKKLPKKSQSKTKTTEELSESNIHVKVLQLRNTDAIVEWKLFKPRATYKKPGKESLVWVHDDPNGI